VSNGKSSRDAFSQDIQSPDENVSMDFMESDLTTTTSEDDLFNLETFEMLTDSFPNCLDDNFDDGLSHSTSHQMDNNLGNNNGGNNSHFGQQNTILNTQPNATSDLFNNNQHHSTSSTANQGNDSQHSMIMNINQNARGVTSSLDNE